jgi:hypothetical protein
MGWKRLAGAAVVAGLALLSVPGVAVAQVQEGIGHKTEAQGYIGEDDGFDWIGSYVWQGKQVWCVQYALKAPDSTVAYQEGDELLTKYGKPLPADVAANISYLLLRYSTTTSADESAALAHLLHGWTAAPESPDQLDPATNTYLTVAYDAPWHLDRLPDPTKAAVQRLQADAEANRGPWKAVAAAPEKAQTIGTADTWSVSVTKEKDGTGVPGVPVAFELVDATLVDGSTSGTVTTSDSGEPVNVQVVPTGPAPKLTATLSGPATRPVVHVPGVQDMQRIVTTGGEQRLVASTETTARTAPGAVKIAKTDAETKQALPGVSLRVTGADRSSAAVKQDDAALVGVDGRPVVLQTGPDGTVEVPDLRTPQEICVIEVAAPKGYDENFDPNAPPTACGVVQPGETLALAMENKPNKPVVPSRIPAGIDGRGIVATADTLTTVQPGSLIGLGGVVLLGAGLVGFVAWRRASGG